MKKNDLATWLHWLETNSCTNKVDMSLARIKLAAAECNLLAPNARIITVTGTNGKGSTVAIIENYLLKIGKKVASFTSPHIMHFNERIKIDASPVSEQVIVDAFNTVATACSKANATYFEYVTLAALYIFAQQDLDYLVLEVGMGGRLDAVNILPADVAVISNVSLDHCKYLGSTIEAIAYEKAGIIKPETKAALYCDLNTPDAIRQKAAGLGVPLLQLGKDYNYIVKDKTWIWQDANLSFELPKGQLAIKNIAGAIAALRQLAVPINIDSLSRVVSEVSLPGRWEILRAEPLIVLDVAHNPAACKMLKVKLDSLGVKAQFVFAVQATKDFKTMLSTLKTVATKWWLPALSSCSSQQNRESLAQIITANGGKYEYTDSVPAALDYALKATKVTDTIVVVGSFYTVSEAYAWNNKQELHGKS